MTNEIRDKFLEDVAVTFGHGTDYNNNTTKNDEVYDFWFNILENNYTVYTGFTNEDTQFYIKLYIAKSKKEDSFKNDEQRIDFLENILKSNQHILSSTETNSSKWKVNKSTYKPYIEKRFSIQNNVLPTVDEIVANLNVLKQVCNLHI